MLLCQLSVRRVAFVTACFASFLFAFSYSFCTTSALTHSQTRYTGLNPTAESQTGDFIMLVPTFQRRLGVTFPKSKLAKTAYNQRCRLFASTNAGGTSIDSDNVIANRFPTLVQSHISRLDLLLKCLQQCGVPGCCEQMNDLSILKLPNAANNNDSNDDTSKTNSVESTEATTANNLAQLHPLLYPLLRSQSTDTYICALMTPTTVATVEKSEPFVQFWPIVEAKSGSLGYNLVSLDSELLLRRLACQINQSNDNDNFNLIEDYNQSVDAIKSSFSTVKSKFDVDADVALIDKIGIEKYILLKVGPFADLYHQVAYQHLNEKNDVQSALIATETANAKFSAIAGGASLRFQAQLLASLDRFEEARDAAQMCLRLPLHTIGMNKQNYVDIFNMLYINNNKDNSTSESDQAAFDKAIDFCEKLRNAEEKGKDRNEAAVTPGSPEHQQQLLDGINTVMNEQILKCASADTCDWASVRPVVSQILKRTNCEYNAQLAEIISSLQK